MRDHIDQEEIVAAAPIADVEDFLDMLSDHESSGDGVSTDHQVDGNLAEAIDLCNSLEDLVKTFDKNVKECFTKFKNIDVGQLAPVQVRSQDDIINDSQIWYTLTGNFGDLLPINYWAKPSLLRKYHSESLNLKGLNENMKARYRRVDDLDLSLDSYDNWLTQDELGADDESDTSQIDEYDDEELNLSKCTSHNKKYDDSNDCLNFDDQNDSDLDELREQLDMHSVILSKSFYEGTELDEPIVTAEQVLDEIDSMINEDCYDEMTPDSGYCQMNASSVSSSIDLPIDCNNLSYIRYINTFKNASTAMCSAEELVTEGQEMLSQGVEQPVQLNHQVLIVPEEKSLKSLNVFELNELIEQIENTIATNSEILVTELALRDELEFEKETRNTFISLLTSIHEKRRMLSLDAYNTRLSSNCKRKNRKSMSGFGLDSVNSQTYLTTIIPFNAEIEYTAQHLQILNKLLKAINEDSHQVPELLTNYILKEFCPTTV